MPRKLDRLWDEQRPVEPEYYCSTQDGATAGVAWVAWMQLGEAVATE